MINPQSKNQHDKKSSANSKISSTQIKRQNSIPSNKEFEKQKSIPQSEHPEKEYIAGEQEGDFPPDLQMNSSGKVTGKEL